LFPAVIALLSSTRRIRNESAKRGATGRTAAFLANSHPAEPLGSLRARPRDLGTTIAETLHLRSMRSVPETGTTCAGAARGRRKKEDEEDEEEEEDE
jgi:hypothetical protein